MQEKNGLRTMNTLIAAIMGVLIIMFATLTVKQCQNQQEILPKHTGVTKTRKIIEINPNTLRVVVTVPGQNHGTIVKVDSVSADQMNKAFVTAFKGGKPIATVFGKLAHYEGQ